jgi:hypothetical protein
LKLQQFANVNDARVTKKGNPSKLQNGVLRQTTLILEIRPRISEDIKSCALQLWDHGWDMGGYL